MCAVPYKYWEKNHTSQIQVMSWYVDKHHNIYFSGILFELGFTYVRNVSISYLVICF
jgi:hypothetical protein